jgi:hypothetical protein
MTISTHLRFAASVCVLSTGLLLGSAGGGIAAADTDSDSSGSNTQSQSADGPGQDTASSASGSAANVGDNLPKILQTTAQNVTSALGSLAKPGQQQSGLPKGPVTKPEATDVEDEKKDSALTTGVSTENQSDTKEVKSDLKSGSDSNSVAPQTKTAASVPNIPPAAWNRLQAVSKVVEPVANLVVTVATVAQSVPGMLAALPASPTPIADVIASLQYMLTTVGDAVVPLATQLPSNLFSLLVVLGDTSAPTGVLGHSNTAGSFVTVVVPAPVPPSPPALLVPGLSVMPSLGSIAAPMTQREVEMTALSHDFSISGATALAPESTSPTNAMSFLEHTISAVLVPASLSALAALALPGIAGLLIACGAGMRVGYRQAKAAMAARTSGIARFAGSGPLGIVRSGSLIALRRTRVSRGVRPKPQRAARHLKQVA